MSQIEVLLLSMIFSSSINQCSECFFGLFISLSLTLEHITDVVASGAAYSCWSWKGDNWK